MKKLLIICLQLIMLQSFAQKKVDQIIDEFRQNHYKKEGYRNVTDSLLSIIDIKQLLQLEGNRLDEKCPEFGVFSQNYYQLFVTKSTIEKGNDKKARDVIYQFIKEDDTLSLKLKVSIERIYIFDNTDHQVPVLEVSLAFKDYNSQIEGFGRIITGLDTNNTLMNKSQFYYEEGFRNEWLGKIKDNGKSQIIAWGFNRFPEEYFTDFDIGGGELMINYKYLENGWSESFLKDDFIRTQAEDIPVSDYNYYGVKSLDEIIRNWDEMSKKINVSYGEGFSQLNLGCPMKDE